MESNHRPSVVVWLPDDKTHLVIDAELLEHSRDTFSVVTLRKGKSVIREYDTKPTFPDHFRVCYLARRYDPNQFEWEFVDVFGSSD